MFPLMINKSWYEEHWYGERPAPRYRLRLAVTAGRLTALVGLMLAGLRGLGQHWPRASRVIGKFVQKAEPVH